MRKQRALRIHIQDTKYETHSNFYQPVCFFIAPLFNFLNLGVEIGQQALWISCSVDSLSLESQSVCSLVEISSTAPFGVKKLISQVCLLSMTQNKFSWILVYKLKNIRGSLNFEVESLMENSRRGSPGFKKRSKRWLLVEHCSAAVFGEEVLGLEMGMTGGLFRYSTFTFTETNFFHYFLPYLSCNQLILEKECHGFWCPNCIVFLNAKGDSNPRP